MTVRNKTDLKSQVSTLLPDNTSNLISPANVRSVFNDIIDSMSVDRGEVAAVLYDFDASKRDTTGISQAEWISFVAGLPNSVTNPGQKIGDNNQFIANKDGLSRTLVPVNFQVPEMTADGLLWTDRADAGKRIDLEGSPGTPQTHCMFGFRSSGLTNDPSHSNLYLPPNFTYRIEFDVDMAFGGMTLADWAGVGSTTPGDGFCILQQLHPGTHGSVSTINPIFAVDCRDGTFVSVANGAVDYVNVSENVKAPVAWTHQSEQRWPLTTVTGVRRFMYEIRMNYRGFEHDTTLPGDYVEPNAGVLPGWAKVFMDDAQGGPLEQVAEFAQPLGVPRGATGDTSCVSQWGIYGSELSAAYHRARISLIQD